MPPETAIEDVLGFPPYPWQTALYQRYLAGEIPESLAAATGCGKTVSVPLYFAALAQGAPLPRRLIYIVDRRAIVDQTSAEIERWFDRLQDTPAFAEPLSAMRALPGPERPVEIGVTRGGIADTSTWRMDPARPAVIVGTVDMIGSRLLFNGYGDGRSMRSMYAGLFGVDTAVILDEAHLSTAMASLLHWISAEQRSDWRPRFRAMTMSATLASSAEMTLTDDDYADERLSRRLNAAKSPHVDRYNAIDDARNVARAIARRALEHERGSVVVYVNSVKNANAVHKAICNAVGTERVALLTGQIRAHERAALTDGAVWQRFVGRTTDKTCDESVYIVATAAAEVGVDLDADHAVMDLVPMDRLIQRLGRVNRSGDAPGGSRIDIVHDIDEQAAGKNPRERAQRKTLELLAGLDDLSPATLAELDQQDLHQAAEPKAEAVHPSPLDIERLAATSAQDVAPAIHAFLHGRDQKDSPSESHVIWRWDVEHLAGAGEKVARQVITFFAPEAREALRMPSKEVREELQKIIEESDRAIQFIVRDARGDVHCVNTAHDGIPDLEYATVFWPAHAGGLSVQGTLDSSKRADKHPEIDIADADGVRYRYRIDGGESASADPPWSRDAVCLHVALHDVDADEEERQWLIYACRRDSVASSALDDGISLGAPQTVDEHNRCVGAVAQRMACVLQLPDSVARAVGEAGSRHDTGKDRLPWKNAAGIPRDGAPMAKARNGDFHPERLGGYRHEFGSLADADCDIPADMASDWRDLCLHLIAAHHGHARPGFAHRVHWDPDLPDACAEFMNREVERRFADLQLAYGPWQLAFLESLIKSADAYVSSGGTIDGL